MRTITKLSPRVKGLGKVIPLLMDATATLPAHSAIQCVRDIDGGLVMELDVRDLVQGYIYWSPCGYERHAVSVMKQCLRPGNTVLDIGANVGYYALIAARLVGPNGRVVAIEADPENYAQLSRNILLNGLSNITAIQAGVAAQPGVLELRRSGTKNRGAHTFTAIEDAGSSVLVTTQSLDMLVEQQGLKHIDFIKIDIEGFEYEVLKGSSVFRWHPIILTEAYEPLLRMSGSSVQEYVSMITHHGYAVEPIPHDELNMLCRPMVKAS